MMGTERRLAPYRAQGKVMDFLFSESQRKLRDGIRALGEKAAARRLDRIEGTGPARPALRRTLAEAGLWGSFRPTACGGRDCAAIEVAIIFEELARSAPLIALALAEHNMLSVRHLERFGDAHQKKKWLAPSAQSLTLGSWCPVDGIPASRPAPSLTRAEKQGEGWVLNGAKTALANGSLADWTIVTAITDVSAGNECLSSFILERGMTGVRWEEAGESSLPEGTGCAGLVLENVHVPAANRLGREGAAVAHAMSLLDGGRGCLAALCLGLAANALETCLIHVRKRSLPVSPVDMAVLASRLTELETARLMTYRAAFVEDRTSGPAGEAEAACARAVDVALTSTALATYLAPSRRTGRKGSSPLERSSAIIKCWLLIRNVLESVRCTVAGPPGAGRNSGMTGKRGRGSSARG